VVLDLEPDSLRRRAIDARYRARGALSAELRRQFLELAEDFDDLADALQQIDADHWSNPDERLAERQRTPSQTARERR
jgi:hypothetical protein